ncbi:MAG: hypothetical protein Q8867_06975 [Bacteroidota bacterium]|nr:hypothetical protein [Bacteroidota bacterium]
MKKIFFACLLIAGILFIPSFYSCNKDDVNGSDSIHIYTVPTEVAAEYIALAFADASGGVNMNLENAAFFAIGTGSIDTSFVISVKDTNKTITYTRNIDYNGSIQSNPRRFNFIYTSSGNFYAKVMASSGDQHGNYSFTSLDTITNPLIVNGSGGDNGKQISSVFKVSFTSNISYTLKDVRVDKKSLMIKDGTAIVHIEGLGPASVSFAYSGTITFSGNRKAILVLNNNTYNMNLETGALGK